MKTGLLLITHGNLGQDMLRTVTAILCECPLNTRAIAVHEDSDPDVMFEMASHACSELDEGYGVLVLTDLYGSTPSNIAHQLMDRHRINIISGTNIPMLLRILNYPDMNLEMLSEKAASGARDGVIISARKQAC
jgi:PTS system ascorbate-specific IIA component